ncbi:hypothetical protein EZS27_007981 [termite gut metagenome]|uniref:FecR protein domain-containing protein n=1 Tax=termite gut metagenome TaxID=433724 RepID=A0A5J4SGK1_9ZZZZ
MKKEILYRFFEGIASLEEEQQIQQWMEASPENERMFLKERKLFDAVTVLTCSLETDKTDKEKRQFLQKYSVAKELLKVMIIVILVLAGGYLYQSIRQTEETVAMQIISVPAGQRVSLFLPDGTKVWLNARTKLIYPVSFNKKERYMELEGEAFFEVAKDKKKSFIVHTGKGIVEALGTAFNIEAYAEKDIFETTLMSGSLRIKTDNNPSEEKILLTPDKKAVLKDGKLWVEQVDDYTPYRWIEGLICFRNKSFMSVMKDFEKYYGVNIHIKSQTVLKYYYTGKFRHTDGIDYALRVLQKNIRFKYTRDDENQIIYIE